jgi:hypothetical protein
VTRREPWTWKLLSAPSSKLGVESIANTNRIVPAVGGEARDKRKRVTFADAVAAHVDPVAVVCHPAWSRRSGCLQSSTANPSSNSSTVACASAPRQSSNAHAAQSGSTSSFSNIYGH